MDRKQQIEILNILYLRIMRLHFSYSFISSIVLLPKLEIDFPDASWCLETTFATDAYTTIAGLFSDGNYSFKRLIKQSPDLQKAYDSIFEKIDNIIPNFRIIRNEMFCHLVEKQKSSAVDEMFINFDSIFNCLCDLHSQYCQILGIDGTELSVYDSEKFEKLQKEIMNFRELFLKGIDATFYESLIDSINK